MERKYGIDIAKKCNDATFLSKCFFSLSFKILPFFQCVLDPSPDDRRLQAVNEGEKKTSTIDENRKKVIAWN